MISIPFLRDTTIPLNNAQDLLNLVPNGTLVGKLEVSTNTITECVVGTCSGPLNFPIIPGEAYIVRAASSPSVFLIPITSTAPPFPSPKDVDADGPPDGLEEGFLDPFSAYLTCDNCPNVFNPDQKDEDKDGFGDVCDPSISLDEEKWYVLRGNSTGIGWTWWVDTDSDTSKYEFTGTVATGTVSEGDGPDVLRDVFSNSLNSTPGISTTNVSFNRFTLSTTSGSPELYVGNEGAAFPNCKPNGEIPCNFNPTLELTLSDIPTIQSWGLVLVILFLLITGVTFIFRYSRYRSRST